MERTCGVCGRVFEARSRRATYCSPTCRSRAHRAADPGVRARGGEVLRLRSAVSAVSSVSSEVDLDEPSEGPLVAAARAELEAVGRVDSLAGRRVLHLARLLEAVSADSGSAKAALDRQLAAAMAEATRGAVVEDSVLTSIRRRRDGKRLA